MQSTDYSYPCITYTLLESGRGTQSFVLFILFIMRTKARNLFKVIIYFVTHELFRFKATKSDSDNGCISFFL